MAAVLGYMLRIMTHGLFRSQLGIVGLALFLLTNSAAAADNWVEVRSPHFTVDSNAGEKEARRIANQFEEIRSVFQTAFTLLRVDSGKPLVILALKNEDSMKVLLPDYFASKDRMRPAGIFVPGFDRNFALVRTDVSGTGENPYHALYHEYTHGIMRLNFPAMPTWLDEGLADFYGNTVVEGGEIGLGRISSRQLRVLQRSPFIPIQTLMNVDHRSPQYNEQDRVSVFYAESWALVHYLMMDPDAKKNQILGHFLKALADTNDSEEAARQSFGDLKKFGEKLESYTRQAGFYYQRMKPQTNFSDKEYAVRQLPTAEVLTLQADFLQHTGHGKEAKSRLQDAIQQQPGLAAAYSDSGYYDYLQHDNDAAEKEFEQAAQLDPKDFRPYYYLADILYRRSGYRAESTPRIIENLEKVVQLNPDFAPAYAFLSVAYRQQSETKEKALAAGVKAVKLDPTRMAYVADVGDDLMALDRDKDAQMMGDKMTRTARTPAEKAIAESFSKRLTRHEEFKAKNQGKPGVDGGPAEEKTTPSDNADDSTQQGAQEKFPVSENQVPQQGGSEDGVIRESHCDNSKGAMVKFAILGDTLLLSAADVTKIAYKAKGLDSTAAANPCAEWHGRKARITYQSAQDKKFNGVIVSIEFQ